MHIKRKAYLPVIIVVCYLVFIYFALSTEYRNGWLIPKADVDASNILIKLSVDLVNSLLFVAAIITCVHMTKKSVACLGFSRNHCLIVWVLFAVYIIFFFIHGNYSLNGVYIALFYLVMVAFCEELIFRGFLFSAIEREYGFWPGAIVSGTLWGAAHAFIPEITGTQNIWIGIFSSLGGGIITGALYAIVLKKTKNILIPVFIHALFACLPL